MKKNIHISLTENEHEVASILKAKLKMSWSSFFIYLVDLGIEKKGLDKEPIFHKK